MAAENRSKDRAWVRRSAFSRAGAGVLALLYVLLSLHPADFKSMFAAAHPEGSAAREQAIPVPGASTAAGEASGGEHKCCCKHVGGICEMGCCAGKAVPSDGPCFRECGGQGASASAASRFDEHMAPAEARFPPQAAGNAGFAQAAPKTLAASRQPPEKVPIA